VIERYQKSVKIKSIKKLGVIITIHCMYIWSHCTLQIIINFPELLVFWIILFGFWILDSAVYLELGSNLF